MIKTAYADHINPFGVTTISKEVVIIRKYLGQYGDCYAAILENDGDIIQYEVIIEDLCFKYRHYRISIYHNNKYYLLNRAYELGVIDYNQAVLIYEDYKKYRHEDPWYEYCI